MLEKFVNVILALGAIVGIAGMLSIFKWRAVSGSDSLRPGARSVKIQKRLAAAFSTLAISLTGLAFSLVRFSSPLEILGGALLVWALAQIGLRNWKPKVDAEY